MSDIMLEISRICKCSDTELKKYLSCFSNDSDLFGRNNDEKSKRITANYYACAVVLTEHFDRIVKATQRICDNIDKARSGADEDALGALLKYFDNATEIIRAYEQFLSTSESIVSSRSNNISYNALQTAAVTLHSKISLIIQESDV